MKQYGKENLIKKLQKMNITQFPSLRKRFHRAKNRSSMKLRSVKMHFGHISKSVRPYLTKCKPLAKTARDRF